MNPTTTVRRPSPVLVPSLLTQHQSAPLSVVRSPRVFQDEFVPTAGRAAGSIESVVAPTLSDVVLADLKQRRLLRPHASGPDVADVQRRLGLLDSGFFDDATEQALVAYQTAHGLHESGVVGQETWGSLIFGMDGANAVQPGADLLAPDLAAAIDGIINPGQPDQMMKGHIVVNGHTYQFISGGHTRGSLPEGTYTVTPHLWTRDDPAMSVDGVGWSFAVSDKWDARVGDTRSLLRIHPDGGTPGTTGCMGIQGTGATMIQFREDMRAELDRAGGQLTMVVGDPTHEVPKPANPPPPKVRGTDVESRDPGVG